MSGLLIPDLPDVDNDIFGSRALAASRWKQAFYWFRAVDKEVIRFRTVFYQHPLCQEILLVLMADVARTRSVGELRDIVWRGCPVIRNVVEISLHDSHTPECVANGGNETQGSDGFPVFRVKSQVKTGFRGRAFTNMASIAVCI